MQTNTLSRTLHDVGLALWTGGATMGALGVNGAASAAHDPRERLHVAGEGWARWTPAHVAAVAAYGVGSVGLTWGNRKRMAAQKGVGRLAAAKTAVSVAALAADAYAGALGRKAAQADGVPVRATKPAEETPEEVAATLRRLRVVQWVVPALTGTLVVLSARMGEQQRPQSFVRGVLDRVRS